MRRLNLYFKILLTFTLFNFSNGCEVPDSSDITFIDINLVDTLEYVNFNVGSVSNQKYSPSNLFDADFKSCWVSGTTESESNPALYLRVQNIQDMIINIFPGYGKSQKLFRMNARPKEIIFSLYVAINPEGYVSENHLLYKSAKFPDEKFILLSDSFAIQSFSLNFSDEQIAKFEENVYQMYDSTLQIPKADSCFILKMEIGSTFKGTHYNDICISEVSFKDRLITAKPENHIQIRNIYLNPDENALLIDYNEITGKILYQDTSSILQIIETTNDNKWANIIAMPAKIEGRAETVYHLVNCISGKDVTSQLERVTGNYPAGNEIYFQAGEKGSIFLMYLGNDFEYHKIELK